MIKLAELSDESKYRKKIPDDNQNKMESNIIKENDKNTWGDAHNNWENLNLDRINPKTELLFNKNLKNPNQKPNNNDAGLTALEIKLNRLEDSNNKDTISEAI